MLRMGEMDTDVEGEQRRDCLPGPPLTAAQAVRQQQQHQADDDVGAAGDVGQRPGHVVAEPVQPVRPAGLEDRDDVRQADEHGEQRRAARYPGMLTPAVGKICRLGGGRRASRLDRRQVRRVSESSFVAVAHLGSFLIRP